MLSPITLSNNNDYILFAKGIYEKDLKDVKDNRNIEIIKDINYDLIIDNVIPLSISSPLLSSVRIYQNEIPQYFTDIESWPKSVNFRCKKCTLHFTTIPKPLSIDKIIDDNMTIKHRVIAYFCNISCANEYNYENYNVFIAQLNERRTIELYNEYFSKYDNGPIITIPKLNTNYLSFELYNGIGGKTIEQHQSEINKYYKVQYITG